MLRMETAGIVYRGHDSKELAGYESAHRKNPAY